MSGKSGLRSGLHCAVLGAGLCLAPIASAPADGLTGTNTLEAVDRGETEGDWVEFWSDQQDGIWTIVVRDRKVVEIIPPGEKTDKKTKAALLKQRATAATLEAGE